MQSENIVGGQEWPKYYKYSTSKVKKNMRTLRMNQIEALESQHKAITWNECRELFIHLACKVGALKAIEWQSRGPRPPFATSTGWTSMLNGHNLKWRVSDLSFPLSLQLTASRGRFWGLRHVLNIPWKRRANGGVSASHGNSFAPRKLFNSFSIARRHRTKL